MKKIIALTCFLLLSIFVLASCGDVSFKEYKKMADYKDPYPTLSTKESVESIKDLSYLGKSNEVIVLKSSDNTNSKTYFYNAEKNVLLSNLTTKSDTLVSYNVINVYNNSFIIMLSKSSASNNASSSYVAKLYDANGNYIASKDYGELPAAPSGVNSLVKSSLDLFSFENVIYRVSKSGSASVFSDDVFSSSLPSLDYKTDEYYYSINEATVTAYDHDLNVVFFWELPFSAEEYIDDESNLFINVLSGEKVLVQYIEHLPEDAEKYDVYDEDGKYNVNSILLDVKSGKEKTLDIDYLVRGTLSEDFVDFYDLEIDLGSITDLATISYFEDGKILENDPVLVSLNGKNAKIKGEWLPDLDMESITSFGPAQISQNRWMYEKKGGEMVILNEKGKVVTTARDLSFSDSYNQKYFRKGDKLFDHDLTLVYDFGKDGLEFESFMGHNVILVDRAKDALSEDVYYLYNGTNKTKIENFESSARQYYVTREYNSSNFSYTYKYFNESGNLLLSATVKSSADIGVIYSFDDGEGVVIRVVENNITSYYRIIR